MSRGLKTAGAPMPAQAVAAALLSVAGALALAFPPESYPETGPLIALALASGLAFAGRDVRPGVVLAGLGFAGAQLAISLAPGSTLDVLCGAVLAAGAFALGRSLGQRGASWPAAALASVGAVLGVLAVAQKAGLLAIDAERARALGASAEVIYRLEQGRPFATHAVPAALAGALLIAGAAVALVVLRTGRRWPLLLALPLAAGFAVTGSLGAFVGLICAGLYLAAPALGRWTWRRRAVAAAGTVVLALLLVALRPVPVFDLSRPDNPLVLRAGNWRGAVLVGLEQPVAGIGLGAYGSCYPSVRREGDSETRYAHNSWLQLGAETGVAGIALLGALVGVLWRRRRGERDPARRWALAGLVGFAAHNLVDFTAYLPGVAIPALILAGLAWSHRDEDEHAGTGRVRGRPVGAWLLALILVASALPWAASAAARRALDEAQIRAVADRPIAAASSAMRAVAAAPWSTRVGIEAAGHLLAATEIEGEEATALRLRVAALARRIVESDPESPAPWHLLARARLVAGRPAAAWRALRQSEQRHGADPRIREAIEIIEAALRRSGLLEAPAPSARSPAPSEPPSWQTWDDILLGVIVLLALVPILRRWRGGPAPAEALALALVLILVGFGHGGALPGARLGRALMVGLAALVALFPRTRETAGLDREVLVTLGPALAWASLAAALAPARLAARDGLATLAVGLVLVAISHRLARTMTAWPHLVARLLGIGALLSAALWLIQRAGLALGLAVERWPPPLEILNPVRPAADFLHPGHLGTFLVAGGWAGVALAFRVHGRRRGLEMALAATLILLGLLGGGRAPIVALAAGGLVLALRAPSPALRRTAALLVAAGLLLGIGAVAWRFTHGDPGRWTRTQIWSASLEALAERPVVGYGPGGFAPLAPGHAFEDPGDVSRFPKVFRGPHSDLLGLMLALGLPGGLLMLAGLAALGWRAWRGGDREPIAQAACLAALAALAGHALVDDLFGDRPAAWVAAALLLGAAAGAAEAWGDALRAGRGTRLAIAVVALVGLLAAEVVPYVADRALRAGRADLAVRLEPRRARYQIAALGGGSADAAGRWVIDLERSDRATRGAPYDARAWVERARVLEEGCRGLLAERDTCRTAEQAWSAALGRDSRNVFARRARARLRRVLGAPGRAEEDLRAAVSLEPNFLGARLDLASLLADEGRFEEARTVLEAFEATIAGLDGARPVGERERALLLFSGAEWERLKVLFTEREHAVGHNPAVSDGAR